MTTEIEKKAETKPTPIEQIRGQLNSMSSQFQAVLPANVTPEKFIRVAMTAIQTLPMLLDKNRQSFFAECLKCAQDGLLADGREAALVPFKDRVKYIPMVAGICKRIRNSGGVSTIDSQVVYSLDKYESWTDETGVHFKHTKAVGDRGKPVLTYAYAITKEKDVYFEEMSEAEMDEIKKMSSASNSPWKGPFQDEMRRKSAIRRLAKYRLPSSADVADLVERDNEIYDLKKELKVKTPLIEINEKYKALAETAEDMSTEIPDADKLFGKDTEE